MSSKIFRISKNINKNENNEDTINNEENINDDNENIQPTIIYTTRNQVDSNKAHMKSLNSPIFTFETKNIITILHLTIILNWQIGKNASDKEIQLLITWIKIILINLYYIMYWMSSNVNM